MELIKFVLAIITVAAYVVWLVLLAYSVRQYYEMRKATEKAARELRFFEFQRDRLKGEVYEWQHKISEKERKEG